MKLKVEVLTQDDPLYILPFFEEFLGRYAGDFEITGIFCSPTMGTRPRLQMARELMALYRPSGFLRLVAEVAIDRVLGMLPRSRTASRFYSLRQLCRAHGVTFGAIGNPNAAEYLAGFDQRRPDVIMSVACPFILKQDLLRRPPKGCINIHHAPLPRFKGMMPTFWQLFHGASSVGVTVHYMAAKVDEGAFLLQEQLEVTAGETLDHLIRRSKRHGAHCMAKVLKQIEAGTATSLPGDGSQGSYFTFPTLDEIGEFHRKGLRAI